MEVGWTIVTINGPSIESMSFPEAQEKLKGACKTLPEK